MVSKVAASILQINISRGGIPKRAIGEAQVTALGISGDQQAHAQIHGGPRKAILIITSEGLEELIAQGYPLYAGALGENLTTSGLDRRSVRIGQRYRTPEVVLEISKLREPCGQLNIYGRGIEKAVYDAQVEAGDATSPRWGLGGFYASVVCGGTIRTGDPLVLLDQLA